MESVPPFSSADRTLASLVLKELVPLALQKAVGLHDSGFVRSFRP